MRVYYIEFPFEYMVSKVEMAMVAARKLDWSDDLAGGLGARPWGGGEHIGEIAYFIRKTTYSNRKFDIIDFNEWLI